MNSIKFTVNVYNNTDDGDDGVGYGSVTSIEKCFQLNCNHNNNQETRRSRRRRRRARVQQQETCKSQKKKVHIKCAYTADVLRWWRSLLSVMVVYFLLYCEFLSSWPIFFYHYFFFAKHMPMGKNIGRHAHKFHLCFWVLSARANCSTLYGEE